MPDQTTMSAHTDRHPDFEHVAVYHAGDDDLAERPTAYAAPRHWE